MRVVRALSAIASCICIIWVMSNEAHARGWRGIVPLHSTCEDVKRLLGNATCRVDFYDLKDETVSILFSERTCDQRDDVNWNVLPGTVLSIDVNPKTKRKLSDLHLNERNFKKVKDEHLPGIVYYSEEEEGITLMVFPNGEVGKFFYGPAASDYHLRCSDSSTRYPQPKTAVYGLTKVDEYGKLPFAKEKERLDQFAIQLNHMLNEKGYVIAYGDNRLNQENAVRRANRAKRYLVTNKKINVKRIVVVYGGYRDGLTIELRVGQ